MARFTVSQDIINTLKTWANLLTNLSLPDNFKGYEWEGDIEAGEVVKITHPLKVIPTRFIVTDNREGASPVFRPDNPHPTYQFFYLTSASDFHGKVLILP